MEKINAWLILLVSAVWIGVPAGAAPDGWRFQLLEGDTLSLADREGPVLVVNTASLCAFTPQYEGLQALHERYGAQGLLVLAVPSDDFRQELASDEEVKEFCSVNFDLTLPIATITPVRGPAAHPFFADIARDEGAAPRWNFTKYLVRDGELIGHWPSSVRPDSRAITRAIDAALP